MYTLPIGKKEVIDIIEVIKETEQVMKQLDNLKDVENVKRFLKVYVMVRVAHQIGLMGNVKTMKELEKRTRKVNSPTLIEHYYKHIGHPINPRMARQYSKAFDALDSVRKLIDDCETTIIRILTQESNP